MAIFSQIVEAVKYEQGIEDGWEDKTRSIFDFKKRDFFHVKLYSYPYIKNKYGHNEIKDGDWIVRNRLGERFVYSSEEFNKLFDVVGISVK